MSKLIVGPNDSPIQPAFDKYWDAPMTRREAQVLFKKIGNNQTELYMALDTANIVVNFLCEKLNVTRGELDAFVEKKKAEAQAWVEGQICEQEKKS